MKKDDQIIINKLLNKIDLNSTESKSLIKSILNNNFNEIQTGIILTLLNIKKESLIEIHSFVECLRTLSIKLKLKGDLMDTCGTGGDNKNSFNFSTATSILLSTFEINIAKHGNRSVTSKSGSFDVLESLGIKITSNIKYLENYYKKHNICFLYAPFFHSSLKTVANVRKSIPFKTIFNLLGPLLNPVKLKYQLLGVSKKENLSTHAACLKKMGLKKGWVVFNENGYDELTTTSKNYYIEVSKNKIWSKQILDPEKLGFKKRKDKDLQGGTPEENAFLMRRLFEGETGAIRDNVLLNTAAALVICEKAESLKEGIKKAEENIDSGLAKKKLNQLISF